MEVIRKTTSCTLGTLNLISTRGDMGICINLNARHLHTRIPFSFFNLEIERNSIEL